MGNDNRKFGAITSSTNPEEIATRVKGIVLAVSSLVILIMAKLANIELTPDDMVEIATQLGMAAGAITSIYGVIMWILSRFFKR